MNVIPRGENNTTCYFAVSLRKPGGKANGELCLALDCILSAPAALDRYLAALPAMSLSPVAPLKLVCCPRALAPTLATLPSMSLIPIAPFA
jgi:hypothetical protein